VGVDSKKKAWKKYSACRSKQNYQKYAETRNKATKACRDAKLNFERELAKNIKTDNKSFWKYVRSQYKTSTCVCDLESPDGTLSSSDTQKAELLNAFFASVFTSEDMTHVPDLSERKFTSTVDSITVTPEKVCKLLNSLKTTKSPGIDAIHPLLLKECRNELCEVLSKLYESSLIQGIVPDMWRKAQVSPLFKKGNRHSCSNYRPVSLTVILCKLLEKLIREAVMTHMEGNKLFTVHQHGFREKHSCVTQLIEVVEHWSEILEQGGNVDCIYLDFAKAFDTVPYTRLMKKLHSYGIRGHLWSWIKAFLNEREQQVKVGASLSSWSPVRSGIPQGSVLGPTLFLIYINDLPEVVTNMVKLFADDTKLYRTISTPADTVGLQDDLNNLHKWSEDWQLSFNAAKCKCVHFGKDNPKHQYSMDGTPIENVRKEKDLGVIVDEELNFSEHIATKVKKANQAVGMIKNTFTYLDKEIFLPLYKSFVRPHVEYASVVWSPTYKKDIISVEHVQRRATRLVPECKNMCYEERLRFLGLPTLCYRRQRADMIQLFKILHDYESVNLNNICLNSNNNRGHEYKLSKSFAKTRFGQNRFSNRTVNHWNRLSQQTVTSSSVNSFKSNLNQDWKFKDNKFDFTDQ